jgi:hypothetical protein
MAAGLWLALPAAAQEGSAGTVSAAVAARFSALPDRLAGLSRVDGGYDRPMAAYRGKNHLDPLIIVVVGDASTPIDWRKAAELGRANARQAGLIETLFEGKFSATKYPAAVTFFGDYLTNGSVRQSWLLEDRGLRITVSATIYRVEDRRAVFDAIRKDLLDGAEISGKVSPADAN